MSTYSRSAIISLLKETLSQLRELSGQFFPCEPVDQFIIRLKMMENLARLAFNYSIKVSYLNECMEYAHMAEMLDDVLIQVRRANVGHKARNYGVFVMREYDAMYDSLDLIDARLKTVRVVCFNSRSRKVSKNSKFADNKNMTHSRIDDQMKSRRESDRKRKTPYKRDLYPCELPNNDSEPEYKIGCCEAKLRDFSADYDSEMMTKPMSIVNVRTAAVPAPTPEKTPEELEADKIFAEFARSIRANLDKFHAFTKEPNQEFRLILQCEEVIAMFKFIADNGEYIRNEPRFRKYQKNGGYSFIQVCISKCSKLYKEIGDKYDSLRLAKKRANPTLRTLKANAMNVMQTTKYMLCKHYIEHPVEKEDVEYVIRYSYPK